MVAAPDYEPALAIVASLSALVANFIVQRRKAAAPIQQQKVTGGGVGIQAGGDVTVGNIRSSAGRKPGAK